jgi:hypothetical protein
VRTNPFLVLITTTVLACTPDSGSSDDSEPEAKAPEPIGPKLYEDRIDCREDDPLCWATTIHRRGTSVQALHFHGHDGPYLFEQRGELKPEISVLLDQTLAEVDPSKTELVDYVGVCEFASHPPLPVYLYVDHVEFEVLHHCPPEGFAALEMLVDSIEDALSNCDVYQTILTTTDCVVCPPCEAET